MKYFVLFIAFSMLGSVKTGLAADPSAGKWSIDLTPPFALSQKAPQLRDLWTDGEPGNSNLCAATSAANELIYLRKFRKTPFENLKVPYDQDGGGRTSSYDFLRYIVDLCNTTRKGGTFVMDSALCMTTYFLHSGYKDPFVRSVGYDLVSRKNGMQLPMKIDKRTIRIQDIQYALQRGLPVHASVGWYKRTPKGWKWYGGHAVTIYGISIDPKFEGHRVLLKITNPWEKYPNAEGKYSDTVEMSELSAKNHELLYKLARWELQGKGFTSDEKKHAVLDAILIASPVPLSKLGPVRK